MRRASDSIASPARTTPNAQLNPADFGIRNGITQPIGLPQINIAGGALNFGGPSTFPSGRGDTTFVAGDTLSCLCGRHSLKIGGEFRQFLNNNFRLGTGSFNFPSVAAFLAGTANSFSVTLGNQSSSIAQGALGFFVQDNYKWRPNLTLELGLRYDWNMTPERALRPLHRLRPCDPPRSCASGKDSTRSTIRTIRTFSRDSASPGTRSRTERPRCEAPTRSLWTSP